MVNEAKQKPPRRYEKMRDSGVAWIGMVPENATIVRLKHLTAYIESGTSVNAGQSPAQNSAFGILKTSCVSKFVFSPGENKSVNLDEYNRVHCPVCHNTIIVSRMNTPDLVGACGYVDRDYPNLFLPDRLWQVHFKTSVNVKYLWYYLQSCAVRQYYASLATGTSSSMQNISQQQFLNVPVVLFPDTFAFQIVAFLDNKCQQIDAIIAEAKASIEEYKAWKASIIYEAVTKGLDPHAEMKDSGVEWIGEMPAHWSLRKIKYVAQFAPKCDFSKLNDESLITFTPMECIRNGYFENRSKQFNTMTGSYTPYAEGDIVFAKVTPCFENGNICIMKNLYSGVGLGSSELFVLRAHSVNTEYLFYYLQHPGFVQRACASMTGTGGLKRVSSDFVQNCPLPIPPEEEQHKIVNFLNRRCTAIEQLISDKNALIEELESYKKSLIYEVVTGKRKVV